MHHLMRQSMISRRRANLFFKTKPSTGISSPGAKDADPTQEQQAAGTIRTAGTNDNTAAESGNNENNAKEI